MVALVAVAVAVVALADAVAVVAVAVGVGGVVVIASARRRCSENAPPGINLTRKVMRPRGGGPSDTIVE